MKYFSVMRLVRLCLAALSVWGFTSCSLMTEDREDCYT